MWGLGLDCFLEDNSLIMPFFYQAAAGRGRAGRVGLEERERAELRDVG